MLTFYDLYLSSKRNLSFILYLTFSSVSKKLSKIVFFKDFMQVFLKFMWDVSLLSDLDLDFDLDFTLSHFKITLVSKNFQRYVSLKLCTDMHFDGSSSNVCIIIMTLTFSLTLTLPFFIFIERHTYAILNLKDQKYAFCSFKKCWDGEVMDIYSVVWPDWV